MSLAGFIALHAPAFIHDEARYNRILGILSRAAHQAGAGLNTWTLGGPGECAIEIPGRPIVLGRLSREQCRLLAERLHGYAYAGVSGIDPTADWFAERANDLGQQFSPPEPQAVLALESPPRFPDAPGTSRPATRTDLGLISEWTAAFVRETGVGNDEPNRERIAHSISEERLLLWQMDGTIVSMAAIARRTRNAAVIAYVYTPPEYRGRGFAGSVTAALSERIFREGRKIACLHTDLRNPVSNRCYVAIGFRPVALFTHYLRNVPQAASPEKPKSIQPLAAATGEDGA